MKWAIKIPITVESVIEAKLISCRNNKRKILCKSQLSSSWDSWCSHDDVRKHLTVFKCERQSTHCGIKGSHFSRRTKMSHHWKTYFFDDQNRIKRKKKLLQCQTTATETGGGVWNLSEIRRRSTFARKLSLSELRNLLIKWLSYGFRDCSIPMRRTERKQLIKLNEKKKCAHLISITDHTTYISPMQTKSCSRKKPIDDDTTIFGRWRDKRVVELLINMEENPTRQHNIL